MTMGKNRPRFARLLPSVIVVSAGLLVLNASGLIHDAKAGPDQPAAKDAMAPQPSTERDFAGDQAQPASASEVDVLTSLAKRRGELDARQAKIRNEANILAATETRVDAKIAQLKSLQTQITALLAQRDAAQEKQVASLIKTYGPDGMPAKNAAAIFNNLPDEVLIPVAQGMKPGDLGQILKNMNPDAAQKLTMKLANKLTLPATADVTAPLPAAAPPPAAPGPKAAGPAQPVAAAPPAPTPAAPKNGG